MHALIKAAGDWQKHLKQVLRQRFNNKATRALSPAKANGNFTTDPETIDQF